jgi:hypothetical protein
MLDAEKNPTMLGEWSEWISQRRCHNCGIAILPTMFTGERDCSLAYGRIDRIIQVCT